MNWKILLLGLLLTSACKKEETDQVDITYSFNFNEGLHGWEAGFADYPEGEEEFYELNSAHLFLPAPLDQTKKAFMIEGNNHSDDLFMFLKKQVNGLSPSATYSFVFNIELATNAAENSVGTGGSPAHSVYVKAGATAQEPIGELDSSDNHYRMNIDKGNQAAEGDDMINLGDMSNGIDEQKYVLAGRNNNSKAFTAQTDNAGNIWLVIGFDSGFESKTTTYLTNVSVVATERQ
jgi:hypothetical protein